MLRVNTCRADMTVKAPVRSLLHIVAHSHSHCADLPMKFHRGSPHFSTSLLSPSSLTPLFISVFPSSSTEGREDLSLTSLSLPNDGR